MGIGFKKFQRKLDGKVVKDLELNWLNQSLESTYESGPNPTLDSSVGVTLDDIINGTTPWS